MHAESAGELENLGVVLLGRGACEEDVVRAVLLGEVDFGLGGDCANDVGPCMRGELS